VSPMFSAPGSTKGAESPPTSDTDEEPTKKRATRARSTLRRKRALSSDLDESEHEEAPTKRPAAKRRAVANRAYVEIPYKSAEGKKKAGVSLSYLHLATRHLADAKTTRISTRSKGKAPVRSTSTVHDDEALSEPVLEFDEDPLIEESDGSGSEFVVSDESEAEAVMLDAAIRMSLETNRNTAGSSASKLLSPNPDAVLRAAAAERRLNRVNDVDDYPMSNDDDASLSESEDDVPLSQKGKGAKKSKKGVTVYDTKKKHMTLAQMRKVKREERLQNNAERKALKAAERALRAELGRPLTYVSLSMGCSTTSR